MNAGVFVTHQPVINKQQVVTANRLLVHTHGTGQIQAAVATLRDLNDVWPSERTMFLSLTGAIPDFGLPDRDRSQEDAGRNRSGSQN